MNRLAVSALVGPLLLQVVSGMVVGSGAWQVPPQPAACKPSPTVLQAAAVPVPGLSTQQVENATAIINAAAQLHVPERGQTIAVMTALEASSLGSPTAGQTQGNGALGLFAQHSDQASHASRPDAAAAAQDFYRALTRVKGWQSMPPTLAAHAAQRNLDPEVYARWWPQAASARTPLVEERGPASVSKLRTPK